MWSVTRKLRLEFSTNVIGPVCEEFRKVRRMGHDTVRFTPVSKLRALSQTVGGMTIYGIFVTSIFGTCPFGLMLTIGGTGVGLMFTLRYDSPAAFTSGGRWANVDFSETFHTNRTTLAATKPASNRDINLTSVLERTIVYLVQFSLHSGFLLQVNADFILAPERPDSKLP